MAQKPAVPWTRQELIIRGRRHVAMRGSWPRAHHVTKRWQTEATREYGSWREYIVALGFRPTLFGNSHVVVPAAPILEAVDWHCAARSKKRQTVLGADLARSLERTNQTGTISERLADQILTLIGRNDLWHTDERLYGVGNRTLSGEIITEENYDRP